MKRTILAMYLGAFILGAETPASNAQPKLQPYQTSALANALRASSGPASARFAGSLNLRNLKEEPRVVLPPETTLQSPGADCAIPLLEARVNREVDRKMQFPIKPDSAGTDAMPKAKGLPACRQDR
jgi:hypothetical protein